MPAFICSTCGTQYPAREAPPVHCPVCEDERQFIPPEGQSWTTLERLRISHHNGFRQYEPGLIGIGTTPKFAIGQRALLVCTPEGNILWDCISLIDDATITIINGLGGLRAIAISHPHFYTTLVDWSRAFGNVPVYLHADDADWVRQPDGCIKFWQGDRFELMKDITLIRGGGHFSGSSMLHWAKGAGGRGIVCASDTAYVAPDKAHVSFMRSYPNFLPLPAKNVRKIAAALAPFKFDMMFGNFFESVIESGADAAVQKSAERYIAAIYAERFDNFSGEQLKVIGEQSSPGGTIITSQIVKSTGEPVNINYLVRQNGGGWQIADVYLNGTISELATRRSEFSGILRSGGINGLITARNNKAAALAS